MSKGSAFWISWAGKSNFVSFTAVAVTIALLAMGLAPMATSNTGSNVPAPSSGTPVIAMLEQGLELDTVAGYVISPEWRNPGTELRLVKFTGSAEGHWPAGVEKAAGKVLHSIGDSAVVVRANARQESALKALDYVEWTGPYEPRFKVFANLMDMTGDIHITVTASPDVDTSRMMAELGNLGAWEIEDTHYGAATCWIPAWKLSAVARLDSVLLVEHLPEMTTLCSASGRVVQAHDLWVNTVSNLPQNIMGQGQIVHVQDSGFDTSHRDFTQGPLGNRILYSEVGSDSDGHGTFMSGIVAGNGYNMELYLGLPTNNRIYNELAASNPAGYPDRMGFAGRAPEATIYFRAGLTSTEWANGYAAGARIFSNSWGPASMTNLYESTADTFMSNNAGALVLFAAGRDGPRANTVSGAGNGKLAVSVGGFENIRPVQGEQSDDPNQVMYNSARGPVADGRVKPDVLEIGENVYGPKSDDVSDTTLAPLYDQLNVINVDPDAPGDYTMLSGTSVAVAAASGDTALIRDYLVDVRGIPSPHANLMKTLLIHGADDMGYGYPSYDQGWGRVNVRNSICPPAPNVLQWHHNNGISSGYWDAAADGGLSTNVIDDSVPLKITMAHWDTVGSGALTCDLDLVVTSPSGVRYEGNAFSEAWSTPIANAAAWSTCKFPTWMGGAAYDWDTADDGGDDINNVELFRVDNPEMGQWTVRVVWRSYSAMPFTVAMTGGFNPAYDVNAVNNQYKVSMEMDRPRVVAERDDFGEAVFTAAPGGSFIVPYSISNGGTGDDSYLMTAPIVPTGFSVSFFPAGPVAVNAGQRMHGYALVTVGSSVIAGSRTISLKAQSVNDATAPIAQSQVKFQVDVQTVKTPPVIKIADSPMHEDAPSMVSWSSGGIDYVACAYRQEERHGRRVYFTLSSDGGRTWSPGIPVSSPSWSPGFVGITRATTGTYQGRLMIAYTAWNPDGVSGSTTDTRCGYVKVAYADSPYTTWTEVNAFSMGEGVSTGNTYRTVNVNWVPSVNQFYLTVENFGYTDSFGDIMNSIACIGKYSTNGGAAWSSWTRIDPAVTGLYYFFPNTAIDALGNMFLYYYHRDSSDAAQDRDMTYQYYTGVWSAMRYAWDSTDNLMFPQACFAPQGVNGNRAYGATLKGANTDGDRYLYLAYTDNPAGNPPTFTTNIGPLAGGLVMSDQDYPTRFLIDGDYTNDGYVWWTAMGHQKYDPYGQPNIFTVRDDNYAVNPVPTIDYVTQSSYQKGKQRTTNISEDGGKLLVAWNQMTKQAGTDILCSLIFNGFQTANDTLGPVVEDATADKLVCNVGDIVTVAASLNDWPAGGSNIAAAQYRTDMLPDTWVSMQPADGGFGSPAEAALSSAAPIDTTVWSMGWHWIYVRGQDSAGNWGQESGFRIYVDEPLSAAATVTGPSGAGNTASLTITYIWQGIPSSVNLYYTTQTVAPYTWTLIGNENPVDGTRAWTAPAGGTYGFKASAVGGNSTESSPPLATEPPEATYVYDITPPAPPTCLTVENWGPTATYGSTATETRYLRGVANEVAVNGLTGYFLATTNSNTAGNWAPGNNVAIHLGMRVYVRSSAGVETEISSGLVATVSRTAAGSGFQTATWTPPETYIPIGSSIVVRVYGDITSPPTTLRATFTTAAIGEARLDANQWTVQYWTRYGGSPSGSDWYWGTATYDNNIAGFQYTPMIARDPLWDNTLNWIASADDGAGANDVSHYKIYRSDTEFGTYDLIDTVPAGTCTYLDPLKGRADSVAWWYIVRAVDGSGNEEQNTNAVPEVGPQPYNINLMGKSAGQWVFLSFPVQVSGHVEYVLNDTTWGDGHTNWDVAKTWDNAQKKWLSYRKSGTANTFTQVNNRMGFWLHLTSNGGDQALAVCPGDNPGSASITLYVGWNMVGYPSLTAALALATLPSQVDMISVWQAASPYIQDISNLASVTMSPGNGYWVRVTADCVWSIGNGPASPYLTLNKAAPPTASPGSVVNYTVTVMNIGSAAAYNVTIIEYYPAGVNFGWSSPVPDQGNNVWLILSMAPGEICVIEITVLASLAANGTLVNNVGAHYTDGLGTTMTPVLASASTLITVPHVQLMKSAPAFAEPGETIAYTLDYVNDGGSTAYNAVLTETYPPDVIFVSSTPPPSMGNNVWSLGDLAPGIGGNITIFMSISPGATGTLVNSASLDYDNNMGLWYRTWANASTVIVNPLLDFQKSAPFSAQPGQIVNYTLGYANNGTASAYGLEITETYPAGVTFVSSSPAPDIGNNIWLFPTLPAGGSGCICITVMVDVAATGTLTNRASLHYENGAGIQYQAWANASTSIQVPKPVHNINTDEYFYGIQTAIDDADTLGGHTITVAAGTYTGGITVTKSVRLLGESNLTTFIEPLWGEGVAISADNVTLSGFSIHNAEFAISIVSDNNIIEYNNISYNSFSFMVGQALHCDGSGNLIANNEFFMNDNDIVVSGPNTVRDNILRKTYSNGITAYGSGSLIYHNWVLDTQICCAEDRGTGNIWDIGYPGGGNYWCKYTGSDSFSGPNQDLPGSDGIGDTPYTIYGTAGSRDNYPLMPYWVPLGRVRNQNTGEYFDAIQAAIDDADTVAGHTIFATAGTYYEHVLVNKAIRLVGENRYTTIICANNSTDAVRITVPGVELTGFTLTDAGENEGGKDAAVEVYHVKNCHIHGNIMEHSLIGVWLKAISVTDDLHIIEDNIFRWNRYGVYTEGSKGNTLRYNDIMNQSRGVYLSTSGNQVLNNTVTGCDFGILMVGSGSSTVYGNVFNDNWYGVYIDSGTGNKFYHNAFYNNVEHLYSLTTNIWDDGYPSGGNYWDTYMGVDLYHGVNQDIPGSDGIGDTPFLITGGPDNYPLMLRPGYEPSGTPAITITKIVDRATAMPREYIYYTIYYNNTGTGVADWVCVTDTLPANVTYFMASPSPSLIAGKTLVWNMSGVGVGPHQIYLVATLDLGTPQMTLQANHAACEFSPNGTRSEDWANVTASWLLPPYVIYGYVKDGFGNPMQGVTVTAVNAYTGESLTSVSDALGRHSVDLASLPSGYVNGDIIQLSTANPSGGSNSTTVNTAQFGEQVDITIVMSDTTAPSHCNESPPSGWLAGNTTPVIGVDVTDMQSGVDASTIRFYIQGFSVMYELETINDGYRVSYWHESGFASGTVVSCRIVARDYAGNLLDYTWSFTVP
jgi:uncharacterized repeat protein (TIGR01451 family)